MSPGRLIAASLVACAVLGTAAPARALGEAPLGWVRYVTAKRAYLRAGRVAGLAAGMELQLTRNGHAVGLCKIDQVGDHEASCPIQNARAGDTFALPTPKDVVVPPVRPAPVPLGPAELQRAAQALDDAPVDKVDYAGTAKKFSRTTASLLIGTVGHTAYVTAFDSQFQQTRLELQLNGLDAHWAGFRVYAHLTAILSSTLPVEQRFRNGSVAQVYLWEAAFTSREVGRQYVVSLGRIWPYHTPGLTVIDGAQLGWRRKDGNAEVGVYGGLVPNQITLYPQGDHYTAGVYFGYQLQRPAGSALKLFSTDGRLGLRGAPTPGVQLELEWAMMMSFGRWFEWGAQARASIGAGAWTRPSFDAARVHFSSKPSDKLSIVGSFRYLDTKVDYDQLLADFFDPRRTYNALLSVAYLPRRWISLSLVSGVDSAGGDVAGTRGYVGPEIGLPLLFRARGGMALGYREELGWFVGRSVYLQLHGSIGPRFSAFGRLSYFEDRPSGGTTDNPYREFGAYLFAEGKILRWLSARLTALGRVGLDYSGENLAQPGGLVLRAELVGTL